MQRFISTWNRFHSWVKLRWPVPSVQVVLVTLPSTMDTTVQILPSLSWQPC